MIKYNKEDVLEGTMTLKKMNLIFYFAIIMYIVSVISVNQAFPSEFLVITKEISYYLTIIAAFFYTLLSFYLKIKQNKNINKKVLLSEIWRPILLVLFVGSFLLIQNKLYDDNQYIPYDCTYMDHTGNVIYKTVMSHTCEKPTVVSNEDNQVVLIFHEFKSGETPYQIYNATRFEDDEPLNTSIEIRTEIILSYDSDKNLIMYQADMVIASIFLFENQYYHTYINERFQVSQVFNESGMTSTQIFSKTPNQYFIENYKRLNLPDFNSEDLSEYMKVIYDLQVSVLPDYTLWFILEKSTFYPGSSETIRNDVVGSGSYHQDGYQLEIKYTELNGTYERNLNIIRNQDQLEIFREIDPIVRKENQYAFTDESFRLNTKKIYTMGKEYLYRFKYYERDGIEGMLASDHQYNTHYNIIRDTYGTQVIGLTRKNNTFSILQYYDYFRQFDYYDMSGFNFNDSLFLMKHPMIEYMEVNLPND
jgi:hypothetical protein